MFCFAFLQCLCVANTTKKTPLFDHNCFKTAPKRSNTFATEKYEPNILHNFRRSEAYDQNTALKHSDGSYNTLPKIIHCSSAKSTTFHPFPSRFARNLPQTTFNGPDPQQWANKQNRASIEPIVIVHLPKRTGRNKQWPTSWASITTTTCSLPSHNHTETPSPRLWPCAACGSNFVPRKSKTSVDDD